MEAAVLHKLFSGEDLTREEAEVVRVSLGWKPWWPFPEDVAWSLGSGEPISWGNGDFVAAAVSRMEPVYRAWQDRGAE